MSILGCIYTVATIWQNSRRGMPAWKTSLLASLTHGLDDSTKEELKSAAPERQRALARETPVGLRVHQDGGVELGTSDPVQRVS
jgi:hypothetical protein